MLLLSLNRQIMQQASQLEFKVSEFAPSTYEELAPNAGILTVWGGASDNTIYGDPKVNHAFRALHDVLHLRYNLPFTLEGEVSLAKLQAAQFEGDYVQEAVFLEVAGQAQYFAEYGKFPDDQVRFIKERLAT